MRPSTYMQDMREIPAMVNEKTVIKCCNLHTFGGGTSLVMALSNRRTNRLAYHKTILPSSINNVKKNKQYVPWPCTFGGEDVHVGVDANTEE